MPEQNPRRYAPRELVPHDLLLEVEVLQEVQEAPPCWQVLDQEELQEHEPVGASAAGAWAAGT